MSIQRETRPHGTTSYLVCVTSGVARLEGAEHLGVATRVRVGGIGRLGSLRLLLGGLPNHDPRLSTSAQHQVDASDQVLDLLGRRVPEFLVAEQFLFGGRHLSHSSCGPLRVISLPDLAVLMVHEVLGCLLTGGGGKGRYLGERLARHRVRRALSYLRGLTGGLERKNGWQLAEAASERTPDGMDTFRFRRLGSQEGLDYVP
jgi:hypothetical protein